MCEMQKQVLQLDPRDNALIALIDLKQGQTVEHTGAAYSLVSSVPAKHKFASQDLGVGSDVVMYGVLVGKAFKPIKRGELLTVGNIHHQAAPFHEKSEEYRWTPPDVSAWKQRQFLGYHRADGQVGTRNYWLVVPLVFCENRNIVNLKQAFEDELGKAGPKKSSSTVRVRVFPVRRPTNFSSTLTASGFCCMKAAAGGRGKTRTISAA